MYWELKDFLDFLANFRLIFLFLKLSFLFFKSHIEAPFLITKKLSIYLIYFYWWGSIADEDHLCPQKIFSAFLLQKIVHERIFCWNVDFLLAILSFGTIYCVSTPSAYFLKLVLWICLYILFFISTTFVFYYKFTIYLVVCM